MRNDRPMNLLMSIVSLILVLGAGLACSLLQPSGSTGPDIEETQATATFTAQAPVVVPEEPTATGATPTGTLEIPPESVGLQVVYAKDGSLYRWQAGEPPQAITGSGSPIFNLDLSDDGQLVAFTRHINEIQSELWAVHIDGSNEHVLVSQENFKSFDPGALAVVPFHFSWVPGTHILAYNTNKVLEGPGLSLYDDLRLVDADSTIQSTLLEPGKGGEFTYSPDGSQIAIITPTTISLINADGSNLRPDVLRYEPVLTYSEYQYYAQPRWRSDSSGLRAMIPPVDSLSDPRPPTSLWEIPIDGSPANKVGEIVAMPFFADNAAYSPDLQKIAFMIETGEPAENIHELHLANADGSNNEVYQVEPLLNFRGWSSDSIHFATTAGENQVLQIGQTDSAFVPPAEAPASVFRLSWVGAEHFLYLQADNTGAMLYLAGLSAPPVAIDHVGDANAPYDFGP